MAWHFKRIYMGDSAEYVLEGYNIKEHLFFYCGSPSLPISEEFMTMRPPLYPLFLAAVYVIGLGNWAAIVLQGVVCFFTIALMRDTLSTLGYNKKYDPLLLLLLIAYPIQFMYTFNIASDILLQFFAVLYMRWSIFWLTSHKPKYAVEMSIALVLGAMVKPIFYPFTLFHLLFLFYALYKKQLSLKASLIAALIPLLSFAAYNSINYYRTGKFHFSSIEAINSRCNSFEYISAKHGVVLGQQYRSALNESIANIPVYSRRYDTSLQVSGNFIKQHLLSYAVFHLMHAARIFIEPGKAEMDLFSHRLSDLDLGSATAANNSFYAMIRTKGLQGFIIYFKRNPSMPLVLIVLAFNVLRLLGFILFLRIPTIPLSVKVWLSLFAVYIALAAGPVANTHYFMPVSLFFGGAALLGLISLFKPRQKPAAN